MQKKDFKLGIYLITTIVLTLGLSISFQSLLAAWKAPSADPPNTNVYAPIYATSTTNQTISDVAGSGGGLTVLGGISTPNLAVQGWISSDGDNEGINIDSNGNVGIGTSNPSAKLDLNGIFRIQDGNDQLRLQVDNSNNKSIIEWRDDLNDSLVFHFDYWDGTAQDKDVMVLQADGNVGIGTNNPSAKLEVNGNIIASAPTADNHVATKAYVDAAGGGGLKVYKSDGTTVLGDFVKLTTDGTKVCDGTIYSDNGALNKLSTYYHCLRGTQTIYYRNLNCVDFHPIVRNKLDQEIWKNSNHYYRSGTDIHGYTETVESYRNVDGTCVNHHSGFANWYYFGNSSQPLCGDGDCQIK